MQLTWLVRRTPLLVAGILATTAVTSCAHPATYRDSVYNQDVRWNAREEANYRRWEAEQHMNHVAFERRAANEQRAYWAWRHDHQE